MINKSRPHNFMFALTAFAVAALVGGNAFAFTAKRYASVEIVDAPTVAGLKPALSSNNEATNENGAVFFSKNVSIPASESGRATETAISAEYAMSGYGNNNVQLSLSEPSTADNQLKFKTLSASTEKNSAKSHETRVKLAAVVAMPGNINSGKHRLSLQLSAIYE